MELRKQTEIAYYDRGAENAGAGREAGSAEAVDPFRLDSYRFLRERSRKYLAGKSVLDYGCGTGVHLKWLSAAARGVTAIDLSQKSVERSLNLAAEDGLKNVEVRLADCEHTGLPDASFDAVFDGGTFSSLELETALKEICRLLKPGGLLIGIETLGHNPATNAKRMVNVLRKRRTSWAAGHIFKMRDLRLLRRYFDVLELRFFHVVSWLAFPALGLPGGAGLLRALEALDRALSRVPFLRRYAFKVVFVCQKNDKTTV